MASVTASVMVDTRDRPLHLRFGIPHRHFDIFYGYFGFFPYFRIKPLYYAAKCTPMCVLVWQYKAPRGTRPSTLRLDYIQTESVLSH